jgi:DNA-binding NarL/FixJ family response regulator
MRILVADAQMKVRSALKLIVEQELGLSVAGEAGEVEGLLTQAETIQPDLVLLDWELPGRPVGSSTGLGQGLLTSLRTGCPHLKVVALSGRPEVRQVALAAGADAFVLKGDSPEQLITTIRQLVGGRGDEKAASDIAIQERKKKNAG